MRTRLLGFTAALLLAALGAMGPTAQAAVPAVPAIDGPTCVQGGGTVEYDSGSRHLDLRERQSRRRIHQLTTALALTTGLGPCGRLGDTDRMDLSLHLHDRLHGADPRGLAGPGLPVTPSWRIGGCEGSGGRAAAVHGKARPASARPEIDGAAYGVGLAGEIEIADEGSRMGETVRGSRLLDQGGTTPPVVRLGHHPTEHSRIRPSTVPMSKWPWGATERDSAAVGAPSTSRCVS